MKSEQYLSEIRQTAGLGRAVLKKLVVEGKTVVFHLVTDLTYTADDVAHAERVSQGYVPEGYAARVNVVKSVPDAANVKRAIGDLLASRFPAAAAFFTPDDIEAVPDGTGGRFFLSVSEGERAQFAQGDVINVLSEELMRRFCGAWYGSYRNAEKAAREMERDAPPPPERIVAPRTFAIGNYAPIDGADCSEALYIADLTGEMPAVTVCGYVSYAEEKLTKNGKPYFSFTLSDGTGQLRASYFSKKATLERVRAVRQGDAVCLTGANEFFGGGFRFTANKIDYGAPPEGFVPEERASRPVPQDYLRVKPEPAADLVQADLFGGTPLPPAFRKETFVVFDLETTGLNNNPVGGSMDRIIEVGAVKIADGQIREKFSSFVACPVRLSAEIVRLTGIEDGMLAGAPEIADVIADFYKFCDGCVLVGHNVGFDYRFIRFYGEQEGFLFSQRQYDTVAFAQELLHLPNYKLNTVADYFGFDFHHHRAFDDAFVTAKIFTELVRRKGGLPR